MPFCLPLSCATDPFLQTYLLDAFNFYSNIIIDELKAMVDFDKLNDYVPPSYSQKHTYFRYLFKVFNNQTSIQMHSGLMPEVVRRQEAKVHALSSFIFWPALGMVIAITFLANVVKWIKRIVQEWKAAKVVSGRTVSASSAMLSVFSSHSSSKEQVPSYLPNSGQNILFMKRGINDSLDTSQNLLDRSINLDDSIDESTLESQTARTCSLIEHPNFRINHATMSSEERS